MADHDMCKNVGCPERCNCFRYLAVPETEPRRQAYKDYSLCAKDYADQWPISGMANAIIRPWRDVDLEIQQQRSGEKV